MDDIKTEGRCVVCSGHTTRQAKDQYLCHKCSVEVLENIQLVQFQKALSTAKNDFKTRYKDM